MAIGSAIERGSLICVYDERGHHAVPEGQGIRRQGRAAGIHRLHRHRALRLDHLHVRRTRHDDLLKGGMTGCPPCPASGRSGQAGRGGQAMMPINNPFGLAPRCC